MFIIHNPTAGRRRTDTLRATLTAVENAGWPVHLLETRGRGHATELAREAVRQGARLVVAAGGDGTIAETVAGLAGSQAPLGVIPLGTANVLAHEMNLPFRPQEVADRLGEMNSVTLWPGFVEGTGERRPFVQMVGAGFDAQVVHTLDLELKRRLGRGAYIVQSLREMRRYGFPTLTVKVDGIEHRAASVIVSKGRLYGGPYLLAPDARPDEPAFSITLFARGGAGAALLAGLALPLGLLGHVPGATHLRGQTVEIVGPAGVPVQADGDPAGTLPVTLTAAPRPVRLVGGVLSPSR